MEGTQTQESTYQSPSFGEVLASRSEPKQEVTPEAPVTEAREVTPEPPAKAEAEARTEVETPAATAPVKAEEPTVPLSALKSVREKLKQERDLRVQAESIAAAIRAQQEQGTPAVHTPESNPFEEEASPAPAANQADLNFRLAASEVLAKQAHPDYPEKYAAFQEAALQNPSLFDMIKDSVLPAEAAYSAGRQILEAKKYGWDVISDPVKYREAIEAEVRAEVAGKAADTQKKTVAGKIADRSKTPTDISQARASGGGTIAEYSSPDYGTLLKRAQTKRR